MDREWMVRKDQEAVSPVIATILMVAITVVLAAVLYVMVSNLTIVPPRPPQTLGVIVEESTDGVNWVLTVVRAPSGLTVTGTSLSVYRQDGSTNLTATALADLEFGVNGCSYSGDGDQSVEVTERILLRTSWYVAGSKVIVGDQSAILYAGTLQ